MRGVVAPIHEVDDLIHKTVEAHKGPELWEASSAFL
jgi:hypothetical protein